MINKLAESAYVALKDVPDGATIMVSGFGDPGTPASLLNALLDVAPREITLICNNAGVGSQGVAALLERRLVRKMICTYPRRPGSTVFERLYHSKEIELELVPQGTLCERIRAAKAGLFGFYTPTAAGTELAAGKEVREIEGVECLLELPLRADYALIRAYQADRLGNLAYQASQRNFGPVMAGAAKCTVVEVEQFLPAGSLDPEQVVTPGIYIDRVVEA